MKSVWNKIKAFFAFVWAKIKAFFNAIADFFKDEEHRFSSGRLIKIGAVVLAAVLVYASIFTTVIPVDRLAYVLPYIEKAVAALLIFSGVVQVSQNVTKQ